MTFTMPSAQVSKPVIKAREAYPLFRKDGSRWTRLSPHSYDKKTAIIVFQDRLLAGFFVGEKVKLRKVN